MTGTLDIVIITTTRDPLPARRFHPGKFHPEQWWLAAAVTLLCLLQVVAIDVRNPLTRTLSSYEYTRWGWLFPASLVAFGIGIAGLAARWRSAGIPVRCCLAGAAVASWATAAFPSCDARTGSYWPGEVHRWASITLMVLVLLAALLVRRGVSRSVVRGQMARLIGVGSVAGLAFLAGQALKTVPVAQLGDAPLAGGLSQRILVAAVAAVLLLLAAQRPEIGSAAPIRAVAAER